MFLKVLRMDLKRGFCRWKFVAVTVACGLLLFFSAYDRFSSAFFHMDKQFRNISYGAIDLLVYCMGYDMFKAVIVLLLAGLHSGSFCQDENSVYLRMILNRTDVLTYTRSKFLANLIVILTASVASCLLCCLIFMGFDFQIASNNADGGFLNLVFYKDIIRKAPILYIVMIGLMFGIVAAMCSSIGLLLSVYQPNMFVCIGSSGFLFTVLLTISFIWLGNTPLDVLALISMHSVGENVSPALTFIWRMLWPLTVILICNMLFERRMKWRSENGIV